MFERILIPLDGSELAEVALPYAEELAGKLGSEITLTTVVSYDGQEEGRHRHLYQFYLEKMVDVVKQSIKRKLGESASKKIKVKSAVLAGDPAEEIVDYADKEKIDLIFMSTHGWTGIKRWAIGSVAYKVVKAASQPVALIRAKGAHSDMRVRGLLNKVLVPLDGSKKSEAVIPYVKELASKLKLEVTFLQALTPDYGITSETQLKQLQSLRASAQDYIENIAVQFKQRGITSKTVFGEVMLEPTGVAAEIMKLADKIKADLVVMSTRGRSEFEARYGEWVPDLGSVTEKMVQSGSTPLLLVKPVTIKK